MGKCPKISLVKQKEWIAAESELRRAVGLAIQAFQLDLSKRVGLLHHELRHGHPIAFLQAWPIVHSSARLETLSPLRDSAVGGLMRKGISHQISQDGE